MQSTPSASIVVKYTSFFQVVDENLEESKETGKNVLEDEALLEPIVMGPYSNEKSIPTEDLQNMETVAPHGQPTLLEQPIQSVFPPPIFPYQQTSI